MLEDNIDFEDEISELEAEIEKQLAERRAKLRGPYAKMARESLESLKGSPSPSGSLNDPPAGIVPLDSPNNRLSDYERQDAEKFIAEQTLGTINDIVCDSEDSDRDRDLMPPPSSSALSSRKQGPKKDPKCLISCLSFL